MATVNRVFITRPAHQVQSWQARLAQQGIATQTIPLLEIEPVSDAQSQQKIKQQILRLDEQACIIFVSQNAVRFAFEWIEQYWPQFPVQVEMLCVGKKTQEVLQQTFDKLYCGVGRIRSVDDASAMTSEALLQDMALASDETVQHKKIMIFRGVGGRTTLQESLQSAGASVEHCELYWRKLPATAHQSFVASQIDVSGDLVSVFSGETLHNLYQVVQQNALAEWQQLQLLVPSERVKQLAHELGFKQVVSAHNASEASMWQRLEQLISSTE
ncbi:Uroporphyrinogen-III synthase [Thalassocella blandensis]|nr:Uroporphyrinogen-III synthase [Thalassocella blandensis]